MNIKINLILLAVSVAVYSAVPKEKNKVVQLIETIPALNNEKQKLFKSAGTEILKIGGIYAGLFLLFNKLKVKV